MKLEKKNFFFLKTMDNNKKLIEAACAYCFSVLKAHLEKTKEPKAPHILEEHN